MRKRAILLGIVMIVLLNSLFSVEFADASSDLTSGLLAYWQFDEGNGNLASDSSGNNYQGTIFGASWVTGKFNQALSFDGISDYVSIPTLSMPNTDTLTVVAWINSDFSKIGYIVYNGNNSEFELANENGGKIHFGVKLANYNWYYVFSSCVLQPNLWHQVVGVWVKGDSLRIYVDGLLVGENTAIDNEYLFDPGTHYESSLGVYSGGVDWRSPGTYYKGYLDNIMIYNRALNNEEISTLQTSVQLLLILPETPFGTLAAIVVPVVALAMLKVGARLKQKISIHTPT